MVKSTVVHLEANGDLQKVVKDNSDKCKLVIVDFYADWCPPCKMLGPVLEGLDYSENVLVVKINVDDNSSLSEDFNVSGIPALYLRRLKDGDATVTVKNSKSNVGFANEAKIKELLGSL